MKTPTMLTAALFAAALLAPLAAADHSDPTHGVLPHSVGDSPLDIHAVDIATPHPYPFGAEYEWEVLVEGADTLALHFERYETNGYISWWTGECEGSELVILDGATGIQLDSFCGGYDADFWTADYETSHLVVRFTTSGSWGSYYGFDVYEVAANGARPLASVPYTGNPSVSLWPQFSLEGDVYNVWTTTGQVGANGDASWGDTGLNPNVQVFIGRWTECTWLSCEDRSGSKASGYARLEGQESYTELDANAALASNPDGQVPYTLEGPTVECWVTNKETYEQDTCF